MLTRLINVLDPDRLGDARKLVTDGRFVNGALSAGMAAQRVKNNQELTGDERSMRQLNKLVMGSLVRHPVYRSAALPLKVAAPYYARYSAGMSYGNHVDDPIMGEGDLYRSDISVTIFLSGPDDYDGGELVIQTPFGEQFVKLPAGDAVIYPSSSVHRVAEVTRGERVVAVSWIQSMVRDPDKRALLHELNQAREKLLHDNPQAEETSRVNHAYINLVRMWSEI
jgi:PKHD-type hydroxylase